MKSNSAQLKIAEKYLGESCPECCHMGNNCCCYFVSKIFAEAKNASLFYGGKTVTYCPNAIKWCKTNLAQIPLYLAMPSDIIFFDWELNGTPNHIGFVDHRIDDQEIATLEGNTTSKGVVARRVRTAKYVQGIFRPHFKGEFSKDKALVIDGQFGYNSIAMLQKALGLKQDGILGIKTVKALQKKVGTEADGSWGVKTSKAVQKMLKKDGFYKGKIDGLVYEETVKALQKWCNKNADAKPNETPVTPSEPATDGKLTVNGVIDKATVKRMQEFFGTTQDGIISGQKESLYKYYESFKKSALEFSGDGSACVVMLQKWLGIAQDGIIGEQTVKAWQKKLGVTVDGSFGTKSAKAWQKYLNEHKKAVYPKDILKPWYDALKTQYEWSKNQKYNWVTPTISSSKKQGTCVTFPAVALQRLGLLPSRGYFYINMDTHKITGRSADYVKKHPEIFEVLYPNKTVKEMGDNLKAGDICAFVKPNDHIMVYKGKNSNGRPIWDTMGHTRGLNITYSFYESRKINMIVRLKKTSK